MIIEKKSFTGGINGDVSQRELGEGQMLNLMNARMGVSEYGRDLRIENIPGTTQIVQNVAPPYGSQQQIGSCIDNANNRILYFIYNSHGDNGIYAYYPLTGTTYPVLYDSQVEGGLGFSKNYRIHSCGVVNGLLYWTDNLNPPRKVNIDAGINLNRPNTISGVSPYFPAPVKKDVITVIKKQPNYPLNIQKQNASRTNNLIRLFSGKFAAFYQFRDGETGTLSEHSVLVPYNLGTDTYDAVDVSFNLSEQIPQDATLVNIAVQYGDDPSFFKVKTWDKGVAADLAAINAHNAGTTALTYRFYNDAIGEALPDSFSVKPYDSVPLLSKTLAIPKDRLTLLNNLKGYNTPVTTSLSATLINQSDGSTVLAQVWVLVYSGGTRYVIDCVGIATSGFYRYTLNDTVFPPSPVAFASLTYVGAGATDVFAYYGASPPTSFTYSGSTISVTGAPPVILTGATCLKAGSTYKICVNFFDRWGRKAGIITNGTTYETADRSYSTTAFTTNLQWSLSNTNAVNEIPDWAEYYNIGMTKNLRTRFFIQARSKNSTNSMTYVTKDANGDYAFATSTFLSNVVGVGVDITNIESFGAGYTFSEGDLCKVYISGDSQVYVLRIIAQVGRWIVCEPKGLNTLNASTDAVFEIYTPYTSAENEPYYERGYMYPITNAGTNSRTYSVTSGSIRGDVTILSRGQSPNTYLTENMSPNDTNWSNWLTDAGRPNFVDKIGQTRNESEIAWSNTYIQGTRTNGLSTFEALNTKNVYQECGAIQKAQIANKVDADGSVMLVICTSQTTSVYLGETQLVSTQGNAYVAQSSEVIGTINVLKGTYGTINPESVCEYLGLVFWIDMLNGCFVQYSSNGLEEISRYGMQRFFRRYCKDFLSNNNNNLDNINGFHHISVTIDTFSREVLVTLPALIYSNYASTLPSYSSVPSYLTSIINRFDVYDSLGKTMSFKLEENKWGSNYEFMPEGYCYIQNKLYAWKNGTMWQHNSNTSAYNTFYGTQYPVRICTLANVNSSALKDLYNISFESSAAPDGVVATTTYPDVQITDLASTDFNNLQSVYYAYFLRDRLSPNASGTADQKLYTGDLLTDFAIFVMAEFQVYSSLFFCQYINIGYEISKGQKQIITPK